MVAALLGNGPSVLRNVPEIKDVEVVTSLLQLHGVTVEKDPVTGDLTLDPQGAKTASSTAIDAHAGDSRIPILLCGPLIHAIGEAFIPDLGGCKIGDRPIDYHLNVLRQFGAVVDKRPGGIHISAPGGLKGAKIALPYPSRGRHRAGPADRHARRGHHRALRRRHRTRNHGPHRACCRRWAPSSRVQTDRTIRIEGVRPTSAATTTGPLRTATRRPPGPPPRWSPAATSSSRAPTQRDMIDVPEHLPQGRRRHSTSTTTASASTTRAASSTRWCWRPTSTPAS